MRRAKARSRVFVIAEVSDTVREQLKARAAAEQSTVAAWLRRTIGAALAAPNTATRETVP
jgi:hypothetical protein